MSPGRNDSDDDNDDDSDDVQGDNGDHDKSINDDIYDDKDDCYGDKDEKVAHPLVGCWFADLIKYHKLYLWRKICHVEKYQISVKNLNNLWSFIEI